LSVVIGPFPPDLLDQESPNIYVTSSGGAPGTPSSAGTGASTPSRYPALAGLNLGMHGLASPGDSPPGPNEVHLHHAPLSRQHSFQHVAGYGAGPPTSPVVGPSGSGGGNTNGMEMFEEGRVSIKRQRISEEGVDGGVMMSPGGVGSGIAGLVGGGKKPSSRARSDSAPLGYGHGFGVGAGMGGLSGAWGGGGGGIMGRPRSGSGIAGRGMVRGSVLAGGAGSSGSGTPLMGSIVNR